MGLSRWLVTCLLGLVLVGVSAEWHRVQVEGCIRGIQGAIIHWQWKYGSGLFQSPKREKVASLVALPTTERKSIIDASIDNRHKETVFSAIELGFGNEQAILVNEAAIWKQYLSQITWLLASKRLAQCLLFGGSCAYARTNDSCLDISVSGFGDTFSDIFYRDVGGNISAFVVKQNLFDLNGRGKPWPLIGYHRVQLALHDAELPAEDRRAQCGDKCQNNCENADAPRPHGHRSFIPSMVGFFLLFAAAVSMIMAFKGAEYADDKGFPFWLPLSLFTALSVIFAFHGIGFLIGV